ILTLFLAVCSFNIFSQNLITISKYPQKVPEGKKWVLPTNEKILVEISSGSLISGTRCNADIMSNPRMLTGILEGEFGKPNEVYGIIFKELSKVEYANSVTYAIVPLGLVDGNFYLSELRTKQPEEVGKRELVFYPRQKLSVGECLQSIQVLEYTLNESEMAESNKKEKEEKLQEEKREKEKAEQNKRIMDNWEKEVRQQHVNDSLENIKLNTYPRVVTRYESYTLDYIVTKKKNGKLIINMVGGRREFCHECDSVIQQLLINKNKGSYSFSLKITPVIIALSRKYFSDSDKKYYKEEKQIELVREIR
ncbi:MAG: hypothetical protein JJE25_14495, partial [Bacteroidia bacterium]|nr:hypothetical protein [Bacteroidia bacterium]